MPSPSSSPGIAASRGPARTQAARVLVLAEERLLGLGVASLLSQRYQTFATESFQRAAAVLDAQRVEIVLWLGDRLDAGVVGQLGELEREHPDLRFCVLAFEAEADALDVFLERERPAVAVLSRSGPLDVGEVVASVDEVLAGRSALEPAALERMLEHDGDGPDALACLTDSEREVLKLMAQGLRNREIARRTWRSEKAVEKRVSSLFHKLGLGTRAGSDIDRRVTAARIYLTNRPPPCPTTRANVR